MKIIGFTFSKIKIERKKDSFKGTSARTKVDLLEIKEVKQGILNTEEALLGVKFKYGIEYSPDLAEVELEGSILCSLDKSLAKETLKGWEAKEKKLPDQFNIILFNTIFRKAGLKALELEDELNLPLHIQMPSIKKED